MNIDANIAAHLSVGPNVNGQQNLTGFVEFFFTSIWWITDEILVMKKYFRLGLKYLIPLKKLIYCIEITVLIIYIVYSSTYIHKFPLNTVYINKTNTSPRNVSLFCCRRVNPFLSKALHFIATSD